MFNFALNKTSICNIVAGQQMRKKKQTVKQTKHEILIYLI